MNYIRQLDSLRAFAVILVIISHWFLTAELPNRFRFGATGVEIFFVLSGFLITGILLENRRKSEEENTLRSKIIKSFYLRRSLRIFPVYYALVLIIYVLREYTVTDIGNNIGWYLTYSSNFMFYLNQKWDSILSHLWSLSVEEQFYLIWPWLMVFTPWKHLGKLIILFIGIGLLFNLWEVWYKPANSFFPALTPACFDCFGLGAFLAWMRINRNAIPAFVGGIIPWIATLAFLIFFFSLLFRWNFYLPARTLVALFTVGFIWFVLHRQDHYINRIILNNRMLVWIGKVSYGLYLYHNVVPWFLLKFKSYLRAHHWGIPLVNANIPPEYDALWTILQQTLILVVITAASWYLFEKPVNGLKSRFSYT